MSSLTLKQRYEQLWPFHERLMEVVVHILSTELHRREIQYHAVESRVKEFDSLARKLSQLDAGSELSIESIPDLCGVRVICLFRSDIEKIGAMIEESFEVNSVDDKATSIPQEQFGYMSTHYVGTLPASYSGYHYDDLKGLRFEIQVRTIAMHSWDTISHYVDYKSSNAIPSELRKDFYALSALFYLADSQFETFYKLSEQGKDELKGRAAESDDVSKQEINLDSLSALMKKRYPDRAQGHPEGTSDLVDELVGAGYANIGEIAAQLDRSEDVFSKYEEKYPPDDGFPETDEMGAIGYADVGVIRVSLQISDGKYREAYIKPGSLLARRAKEFEQFIRR